MLDDMFDYLEHLRERPVWQPISREQRQRFKQSLPWEPTTIDRVHDEFLHHILPFAVGNTHPGFMGWVHGGGTPVGMLAEMLAGGLNVNLGGRDQIPLEVERQITTWARELFSFPPESTGLLVTGSSLANLIGVLVARTKVLGSDVRKHGLRGVRCVAYASQAVHGCIARALEIVGLGRDALRLIPLNAQFQMDVVMLERAIANDRRAGNIPFLIVGTAGSVDVGSIDPLPRLADIAKREKLWLHVDAAFAALGMLSPSLAPLLAGIERADSLAFDFHKWAQVPYDAGFILVRDGQMHLDTFASSAAYLQRDERAMAANSPWPCDFGPDLSRGFRALKVWFTFKTYGANKIGRIVQRTCEVAQYLKKRVVEESKLELLAPVALNIVCFRYRSAQADELNAALVAALQNSGIAAPSTTIINQQLAIRVAVVNHRTQQRDIDSLFVAVLELGQKLESELVDRA